MPPILASLDELKNFLKRAAIERVYVVTSEELSRTLAWAVAELGIDADHLILIPDGEQAKQWEEVEKLLLTFREKDIDRGCAVLALGGGTVGDPVGFAASIYLRGVPYIQVPTTLLSQVDSAHGGKTGINFAGYKNQVGSNTHPIAIVLEPRFLAALPEARIVDGLGEIVKAGLISDTSILKALSRMERGALDFPLLIRKTVAVKRWYVKKDPEETGLRQMLNFGHTVGHAIEAKHHITHGTAVIIGMLAELRATIAMGYTKPEALESLKALLSHLGIEADTTLVPDLDAMKKDKKARGGSINLPVVVRPGKSKIIPVPIADFITHL